MKTLKIFAAALTLAATATTVPVQAGPGLNGVNFNGFRANGLVLNGFRTNGLSLNGFRTNGTAANGAAHEEATLGQIIAVSLPTAIVGKCELADW